MTWRRDYERIGEFRKGSTFSLQFRAEGHRPLSWRSARRRKEQLSIALAAKGFSRWALKKISFSARLVRYAPAGAWALRSRPPAPRRRARRRSTATAALNLPENPQLFGTTLPSVVKATAIVNGEVITQTDIDQRLALLAIANGGAIPADELERLRQQVLRNLIDETLQIQAAKAEEIDDQADADIDKTVARVAGNVKQTPEQMADYLKANGSSIRSIRRQIEGEIAWRRLQSAKIESGVSVGDDEVKAVIDKLEASKGTEEFRVGEIFLSANPRQRGAGARPTPTRSSRSCSRAPRSSAMPASFREASTAAVGGDLGWVRPEQLPEPLAHAVRQMTPGPGFSSRSRFPAAIRSSPSRTRARS